jgi:FAD/FMN-containing dehydrogenase
MKKALHLSKRRTAIAAVVLASAGALGGQKVYELSADPQGEKDCAPLVSDVAALAPNQVAAPAATGKLAFALAAPQQISTVATPQWAQKGGTINDASCLNRTAVHGIVQVTSEEQIRDALAYARANGLKVSIAAVRHSMGGQAFAKQALVLDMTRFNAIALNEGARTVTVQSGATWHDIQNLLHPRYAVKAMQSTDIFSVGGSISVNAHGMDHQVGALGKTIRSMRVMLPDGTVQRVSREQNPELFNLVVGGYGLFGIVLDAELDITDNAIYATGHRVIDYRAFPDLFEQELGRNQKLGLFYGHLSTAPQSFLEEMILYTYEEVDGAEVEVPPLGEVSSIKLRRFVINLSKQGDIPMRLKWFAEKRIEPLMASCLQSRNQAMKDGEACLVSRNAPMHDSVKYLKNNLKNDTDILQEYFVPRDQFVSFVDGMRQILRDNKANVLNASVRVVHQEDNMLNYAPSDMFSVVLYVNQETTPEANARMRQTTEQLIDLTNQHGGTFFLPYQLHYSPEQLRRSYPQTDEFFAAKRRYDPDLVLTNTFYERFANK